jgi:RimJ/RimL family protein N-acetyltransferase
MEDFIIRKLEPEDAAISWKWRNDHEIWKYTDRSHYQHISKEIEQAWIEQGLAQTEHKRFAICIGREQKYIGNITLCMDREGEAAYHIFIGDKEQWGKGIAFRATSWVIEYARNELNLNKIVAKVHQNNTASIKFLTKSGFRKTEKILGDFVWLDYNLSS